MAKAPVEDLSIGRLLEDAPDLGAAAAAYYSEAASVCLSEEGHEDGQEMAVTATKPTSFRLRWSPPPSTSVWRDRDEAAEYGAYCIALLLVPRLTEHAYLERSFKGTGFDFWLGPKGSKAPLFQEKKRLEVSGTRSKRSGAARGRVSTKLRQVDRSPEELRGLEAIIVVVDFVPPHSKFILKAS